MNSRERMTAAFDFAGPDRIPLYYHPSQAGLHVHGQKLLDLFHRYPSDNPIVFDSLPAPPPQAMDAEGRYYERRTDEWGVTWAFRVFGISGQPVEHPFATWGEGLARPLPPLPAMDGPQFAEQIRQAAEQRQDYLLIEGWLSLFMLLYALRPMEDVLMDLATEDADLLAYLDRLTDFWNQVLDRSLAKGVDVVMFADDWATQAGPMVSPDLFRRHFLHRYRQMFDRVHTAGRRVFFHCCGQMAYVLDDLIELGIDGLWPQIGLYDSDEFAARCRDAGVTIFIHPDRQRLIPHGTPEEIRRTIARYADRYRQGGGIFYVEMENDAPWENVQALFEAIDEVR